MGLRLKNFISKLSNIKTVVEIGANDGGDSATLLEMYKPDKFYAFEPDPHNIKILNGLKHIKENVILIEKAVSDTSGYMDFYLSDAGDCLGSSSSLKKPKEHLKWWPHVKFPKTIQVPVTTLDTIFNDYGETSIDFVWMDVQGSELDVLKGCKNLNKIHYICTDIFDSAELYEGMCNSTQFIEYLGNNWRVIYREGVDIVLENIRYGEINNGIVLTCYENLEHTKINLELLRRMKLYENSPIVVITTSPNKEIQNKFYELNSDQTKVIALNAPGNPGVNWEPPPGNYDTPTEKNSWRARYLPARLLYSMSIGFNELANFGIEFCLHLHSDTFWKLDHEYLLIEEQEKLKDIYGIWDMCLEDKGWYAPLGTHPHLSGMHLNLQKCKELGILDFYKVFFHSTFKHYNFISVESLIGCWANYCLCGNSVMGPEDKCCPKYYEKFKPRFKRFYHGNWDHMYSDPAQQGN